MRERTVVGCLLLLCFGAPAWALTQPNGAAIPSAMGCSSGQPNGLAAVFACQCTTPGVCNIGAPCTSPTSCDSGQHGTCETTLWHNYNDNTCIPSNLSGLDPAKNASLTPDTFHPTCGLTFTVVTRAAARFQNAFGWYNVTGNAPDPNDLHVMLDCNAKTGDQVVLDVRNRPEYKGGDIGFFLVTPEDHAQKGACAGGDCCATVARAQAGQGYLYYSQRQFNPDNAGANSFIHLVTYDSQIVQRKFYFAWEDIFGGSDDDFTDLVTSVEGVECSGGGTACDTGMKGVCANGINRCDSGKLTCIQLYQPKAEVCNGLDDDCDGVIDNGATCPDGQVCENGACVPHCSPSVEFSCPPMFSCDPQSGLCMDQACEGVTCPADQICRAGKCLGECDGIACPHGSVCRQGACIDPCRHLSCPTGQVCVEGLCVAGCNQCGGVTCGSGQMCDDTSGACLDPSCPNGCPDGTWCNAGTCQDDCDGAVCPYGQICTGGECVMQTGADGGAGSMNGDGGTGGTGPNGLTPSAGGCGCDAQARNTSHGSAALLLLVLALGAGLRRGTRPSP